VAVSSCTTVPEKPPKDFFDHLSDYVQSASGAWDLFFGIDHVLSYINKIHFLPETVKTLSGRASAAIGTIGIGLTLPDLISDTVVLRNSFSRLFTVVALPHSDPLKTRKIAQAAKTSFLDSVTFTKSLSQSTLFLDRVKILVLQAGQLAIIDGIYNASYLVVDGAELIEECHKLALGKVHREEEKRLSWLIVAKDTTSVALCALALAGIVLGVALEGMAFFSVAILIMTSCWLTLKIASYFYREIVVNKN
jgi:hypothetical protein